MAPESCTCSQAMTTMDLSRNGPSVVYNLEKSDTNTYRHLGIMRRNTGRPKVSYSSEVVGRRWFLLLTF